MLTCEELKQIYLLQSYLLQSYFLLLTNFAVIFPFMWYEKFIFSRYILI